MSGSMRARVVAVGVMTALIALATPPIPVGSAPQQSTPPPPGRILYTGLANAPPDDGGPPSGPGMGPQEIYTMAPDGSDVLRLTNDEWHSHHAAWSPSGNLVAYAKTGIEPSRGQPADQIHVMRSDGSDDRVIMTGDWMIVQEMQWASMAPYVNAIGQETGYYRGWSIDDFLGAISWPHPGDVTYTGDTEELPEGEVGSQPFTSVAAPFTLNKRPTPDDFPHARDVWMAEWTARHEVRLTHLTDNPVGVYDDDPVLSPTGELIAFGRSDGEGGQWVMTMRPDGTDVRQIAGGFRPRWSPDGSQIVYMNEPAVCDADHRCVPRISVINSDGTDPHVIGAGGTPEWGPACTITGTPGDDQITGTEGRDFICAGAGNDLVLGSGGNDTIFGGRGRDRLIGDSGDDVLMGEGGGDHLLGASGRDAIGAADLIRRNDTTAGGPDVDICYLDTKYYRFPRDCEVVRSVYPE